MRPVKILIRLRECLGYLNLRWAPTSESTFSDVGEYLLKKTPSAFVRFVFTGVFLVKHTKYYKRVENKVHKADKTRRLFWRNARSKLFKNVVTRVIENVPNCSRFRSFVCLPYFCCHGFLNCSRILGFKVTYNGPRYNDSICSQRYCVKINLLL